MNTWVMIAGVRVQGCFRAIPAAIQATPIATMASSAMIPAAFDRVRVRPAARSIRFAAITTISPAASSPSAAAPSSSQFGAPSAERSPIVSLPFGHR